MKSMKKLVLVGLILLASVMALVGCKNDSVPEVPKYTVKFETEHGTAPASITVESGTKLTETQLPSLADTADYIFEEWQVKDTTTPVQAGFEVTKNVTLVAKWRDRETTASVTFSPENGTKFYYGEKVTVSLSSTTGGATIKYKIDVGNWQEYSKEIEVTSDTTITAYAIKEDLKPSEETRASYTVRKLTSISITPPTRTVYSVGEKFDSTGMEVTAEYDDGETREVNTWTTDFDKITSEKGLNKTVTVSYTEGEKSVTDTFAVDIVDPSVPTKLTNYISPNNTDDTWTYVAFGEWPQSEAKNVTPSLVTPQPEGLFKGNYYSDSNGKYVKQSEKYYKVEPIVWRVLNKDDSTGQALLLAEKILIGGIPYYVDTNRRTITGAGTKEDEPDTVYSNNYKYSTIRAWLNGKAESDDTQEKNKAYEGTGFLQTAFTEKALKCIAETTVDNTKESTFGRGEDQEDNPYACDNTTDKIFLLSEQEATKEEYGFAEYLAYGKGNTRIRVTTDYAKATGAYQDSRAGYGGWWWLRSPDYDTATNVRIVSLVGIAGSSSPVINDNGGVVPALSISLQ